MIKFQIALEEEILGPSALIQTLNSSTVKARSDIVASVNNAQFQTARKWQQSYILSLSENQQLDKQVVFVCELAMNFYFFEVAVDSEADVNIELQLIKKLDKLPKIENVWHILKNSMILSTSLLEMQLKRLIAYRKSTLEDLLIMQKLARQLATIHPLKKKYAKNIITIITHLRLHILNSKPNHQKKIIEICDSLIRDQHAQPRLLTLQTRVVLFYNSLKTLLGVRNISQAEVSALTKLYETYRVKSVNKYQDHLLHIFFIIKALIFRKGHAMEGKQDAISQQEQEQLLIQTGVSDKLSNWTSVSLDETYLALQQVQRSIIRHRVASLATVIGLKLALPRFCLNFLQLMHDGPFNDQTQTIKLCFQLFQARQYQRLNACLHSVLCSPSCKNLRERQVLLSMCAIFTGLYLGDRQGALLYAKLNHQQGKKLVLRQQTLLQHVGFAYLNLATYQPYLCNRQAFKAQALSVLKASEIVNPNNYLTQYCLGKLLLQMGDTDKAYEHAKHSLMSGRGQWVPYSLIACIYFCQRKISKASTIIQELIKKYKGVKTLHYIRLYLQVNRLLLEVEHDQQVEAAKELRQDIYQLTRERILKNKSSDNLLRYCQEYHQLNLNMTLTDYDDKYFYNAPILSIDAGMFETFTVGYQQVQGEKTILQIIPLLLQAGQLNIAEALIRGLPVSPLKTYHQALLHESKKQKDQAIAKYKSVLSQQPYHTPSLINLSLLQQNLGDALHYLQMAQKFISDSRLWLAKGVILSRQGSIVEANEWFIKQGERGWLQSQPDLFYYY